MAHEFEEFHAELRSVAGDLLAKDRAIDWPALVEAGWVGLEVPEEFGGAGATFAEVAVICEEMGRAASANSYLGGAVLAVSTLNALQPSDTRDRLLADVGIGRHPAGRCARARPEFVPDAEGADRVLLIADGGVVDAARHRDTASGARRNTPAGDGIRADRCAAACMQFDGDPDEALARLRQTAPRSPSPATASAFPRRCFPRRSHMRRSATSSVARSGRSRLSSTRAPTWPSGSRWPDSSSPRRSTPSRKADRTPASPAAMAKSYACGAAVDVVGKAMQLHGGIGYTWESGIHVYLKRAALNRSLFGSPAAHRRELAKRYR